MPGSTPSTAAPTPESSPQRKQDSLPATSNVVTIDPGAKARAAAATGAIEPIVDAEGNAITSSADTLSLSTGKSPWSTILEAIDPDLADPTWLARHGAALCIMEITRYIGAALPMTYLVDLARNLLTLLTFDRFGDFVGDTVIAPVRETAAQALGVLLKYLHNEAVSEVHSTLVAMVQQSWAKRGKEATGAVKGEKFSWEVRHAGLLGLKYEVAVRKDLLVDAITVKSDMDEDVKPDVSEEAVAKPALLRDVVDAAVLA